MEEKTIAIRVPPGVHQALVLLARLAGRPLAEELREAVDQHISRKGADADLKQAAAAALDEIDQESADRKKALQSLLGKSAEESPTRGRSKGRGAK